MSKLYNSDALKKMPNTTPRFLFTWTGIILALVFGVGIFFLARMI